MRRILSQNALLFIRHGVTQEERDKVMAELSKPKDPNDKVDEDATRVSVPKGEVTDVPNWCANTKTWKWGIQDGTLMELVIPSQVVVAEDVAEAESTAKAARPRVTKPTKE